MTLLPIALLGALTFGQVGGAGDGGDPGALVKRIKENLARIDEMLLETAEAEETSEGFTSALESHRSVIRDLEELIRQARYSKSNQSSGGGGDPNDPPPQSQPPPRGSDGSQSDQDQGNPSQPEPEPQSGEQESEGSQPQDSRRDTTAGADERADRPPPPDEIGSFTRQDVDGRWGLLPPKLQERLMNLHVDDVPERYRAWLEAYIRSMNALEQGDVR